MEICKDNGVPVVKGKNFEIVNDEEHKQIILSAVNTTNFKVGPFELSGEVIEIKAGRGIKIKTSMPNVIELSVDNVDDFLKVKQLEKANAELSKRLENIEKAIVNLAKKGVISANS